MFDDIKAKINDLERAPRVASADKVEALRSKYPGIPEDYLTFLSEVGWGNYGVLMLYSGPGGPRFTYGDRGDNLEGIILVGDDMQGYCFGFNTKNDYRVVEIDPRGR